MNSGGITTENLLRTFSTALSQDKDKLALATVVAENLVKLYHGNRLISIYTRIDELDEALLDILAKDLSVGWYLYDGTIEEKRNQIKSCFYVHRRLGTKSAVETAISAIYPGTKVLEWFEYSGIPYHFKLQIDAAYTYNEEKHKKVLETLELYKNRRSVLDGVEYFDLGRLTATAGASCYSEEIYDYAVAK